MKTIINIIVLLAIMGCGHTPPEIDVKYWAGDSATVSIIRAQEAQSIPAADPQFDDYVCMTYDDLQKIHETYIDECSVWKSEAQEAKVKLKACGLLTDENIETVTDCLSK